MIIILCKLQKVNLAKPFEYITLIFNFKDSLDTKPNKVQAIRPRFILEQVYSFQAWGVDSRTPWTYDLICVIDNYLLIHLWSVTIYKFTIDLQYYMSSLMVPIHGFTNATQSSINPSLNCNYLWIHFRSVILYEFSNGL